MGRKLFVGNLPFSTTSQELDALFARIGGRSLAVNEAHDRAGDGAAGRRPRRG
jgi:RNA recognition motif-containing protein